MKPGNLDIEFFTLVTYYEKLILYIHATIT